MFPLNSKVFVPFFLGNEHAEAPSPAVSLGCASAMLGFYLQFRVVQQGESLLWNMSCPAM